MTYDELEAAAVINRKTANKLKEQVYAAWQEAIKDYPEDSRQWTTEQNRINSKWCHLYEWI